MKIQSSNILRRLLLSVGFVASVQGMPVVSHNQSQRLDIVSTKVTPTTAAERAQKAEWTVLLYIQAKNNLHQSATENLSQIAKIGSTEKVQIIAQWHQPGQAGVWRYKIDPNNIKLESVSEKACQEHTADELVNFVRWGVQNHPAEKYALVLWNHGIGILDPNWGHPIRMLQNPLEMSCNQRLQMEGVIETTFFEGFSPEQRGILFDETRRVYMNNQELVKAFTTIKNDVLGGQKLDVIGMDACYMQMAEVAYQLHPFGKYLIASQDVELAQGWNYPALITQLVQNPSWDALQLAQSVVDTYELLYKGRTNLFTQSALRLDLLHDIKENIHAVAMQLIDCFERYPKETRALIRQARNKCQQFSMQTYIDLHSFYTEMHKQLASSGSFAKNLHTTVTHGMSLMQNCVVANTASAYFGRARGISIYFPMNKVDASYLKTCFAQDCAWVDFLCKSIAP